MKFEMTKVYKTQGGQKVRLYACDEASVKTIHGAYYGSRDAGWVANEWTRDGADVHGDKKWDIIGEWEEPKDKMKCYWAPTTLVLASGKMAEILVRTSTPEKEWVAASEYDRTES